MAARKKKAEKKVSPYTLLNRWLFDNNRNSEIPEEIVKDKAIGPQYVLYFFQGSSYQRLINEMFNNYGVFQLDRLEVFKMVKEAARLSGFKPKFIPRYSETKTKLAKALKKRYPYLKYNDVNLLVEEIEESEDRDVVYEMLNLKAPRKYKTKKETKQHQQYIESKPKEELKVEEPSNSYTWRDLMTNFELEEVY